MASNFLDNLKNAVEKGEFNSEAAKKINEINQLVEEKLKTYSTEDLEKKISDINKPDVDNVKSELTKEELLLINSQSKLEMENLRKQDKANKYLATLIDIEEMVKLSIEDMFSYINEIEDANPDEIGCDDTEISPFFKELDDKINEIYKKYSDTTIKSFGN